MRYKVPRSQPASFRGSARYLAGLTKGVTPDRVEWVFGHNLQTVDPETAAAIMGAVAAQSTRCQNPAYHFVLAFDPKDAKARRVNPEIMQEIARETIEKMGLQEYQALVYAHRDTDHPHIHFLVNRVHPQTGRAYSRHNDFARLEGLCRDIALERGLNVPREKSRMREMDQAEDFEIANPPRDGDYWRAKREERPPDRPFKKEYIEILRGNLHADFRDASSWKDLSERLGGWGLQLAPKGQGLVLTDGQHYAKLSSMGKTVRLKELEERFGERFKEHAAREAEQRLREHEEKHGPPPLPHDMPPDERKRAILLHEARKLKYDDQRDRVLALDDADLEFRYWSGIERTYRQSKKDAFQWERRHGSLTERTDNATGTARKREEGFLEGLAKTFRNPDEARATWDRLEEKHGADIAMEAIQANPALLGTFRGRQIIGVKDSDRKEAERSFRTLAGKRKLYLSARKRLELIRGQLEDARRMMRIARRDFEMLQKSAGTPEQVRKIVSDKIKARTRALERVTGDTIARSILADERKEQLHLAWRRHKERKRDRDRRRERSLGRSL
ncbi:MAG: relaxase/mobilization nuclease domain-containing protein [Alphaproteobacteria bacterium]